MKRYRVRINTFIIVIFFLALIMIGYKVFDGGGYYFTADNNLTSQKARVLEILDRDYNNDGTILFSCKLLNGSDKGKTLKAIQFTESFLGESVRKVEAGDKICLGDASSYNLGVEWFLYEYERFNGIAWLALAFAVLLILFGKKKGFKTIISIIFTILTIFLVFIPAVLAGHSIYVCALILCIFITVMSLFIVQGLGAKSYAAIAGCLGGLVVISVITVMMSSLLKITGLVSEDSIYLIQMNTTEPIDLKAVVFASIIIGAMGAILDIAVDIVAALSEINRHNIQMTLQKALKSGIIIGQDIVGSMSNTLILAYIGSSLSLILLVLVNTGSSSELLNSELIIVEILQALAGSIGILFTIPFTALSYGLLCKSSSEHKAVSIDDLDDVRS